MCEHMIQISIASTLEDDNCKSLFVTGFERTHLPRTQQEDTLFTITR